MAYLLPILTICRECHTWVRTASIISTCSLCHVWRPQETVSLLTSGSKLPSQHAVPLIQSVSIMSQLYLNYLSLYLIIMQAFVLILPSNLLPLRMLLDGDKISNPFSDLPLHYILHWSMWAFVLIVGLVSYPSECYMMVIHFGRLFGPPLTSLFIFHPLHSFFKDFTSSSFQGFLLFFFQGFSSFFFFKDFFFSSFKTKVFFCSSFKT